MTVGDHTPEEPDKTPRAYALIYEVSDRARALAPTIAGLLRAVIFMIRIPGVFFALSAVFPIVGVALIAKGSSGFGLYALLAVTVIALLIEVVFCIKLRQYSQAVRAERFVAEIAELVDIADMSDELVSRLTGAAERGLGWRRLRAMWDLWRTPNYFNARLSGLELANLFVPPRVNFAIKIGFAQFWMTLLMWGVLIIALIARLAGAL